MKIQFPYKVSELTKRLFSFRKSNMSEKIDIGLHSEPMSDTICIEQRNHKFLSYAVDILGRNDLEKVITNYIDIKKDKSKLLRQICTLPC